MLGADFCLPEIVFCNMTLSWQRNSTLRSIDTEYVIESSELAAERGERMNNMKPSMKPIPTYTTDGVRLLQPLHTINLY
jgi:hypothetical protein